MRLIKLALQNLLVITAFLVLFTSVGWGGVFPSESIEAVKNGQPVTNGEIALLCTRQAPNLLRDSHIAANTAAGMTNAAGLSMALKTAETGAAPVAEAVGVDGGNAASANAAIANYTAGLSDACKIACDVNQAKLKNVTEDEKATYGNALSEMKKTYKEICVERLSPRVALYSQGMSEAQATSALAKKARNSLLTKVAIGGAAVGGGLLLMDHLGDKKEKKKEKKKEEEAAEAKDRAERGIIKDADGKDLVCFSEQNYLRLECSETMLSLCQGTKSSTAGCRAFNSNYCASSGSGTNYCLYADARIYCSQSGSLIAASPACTWSASRSDECKKSPEQVSCLYSGSPEALNLACASYPSDPLCAAHTAGRIVVQGGSGATATAATEVASGTTATGQDYGDGSSVTMSSVIGTSDSTTATTSNARGTATLAANDSMFTSSTAVASKACAEGLLQDCSN